MSCCRRTLPTPIANQPRRSLDKHRANSDWTGAVTIAHTVNLSFLKEGHFIYRGPVTGRSYDFSGFGAVKAVDVSDAPFLLRTLLFSSRA